MATNSLRKMTTPCSIEEAESPEEIIGPFLPIEDDEVDIFNDILSDEIDSAFTTSICCCDHCYDDFKEHWPGVAFREVEFQENSVEVRWLIETSRVSELYSPAEISTLKHLVKCSRCNKSAPHNIWLYELRFGNAQEIEASIDELLAIGQITPFLLLEHEFARQVLQEIRKRADISPVVDINIPIFRARLASDVLKLGQLPDDIETYSAAPARWVGEGRFNHAGVPMLYCASSAVTAAAEIGTPGSLCNVGSLKLKITLRILDLLEIDDDDPGYELLLALASSALLAAPRTGEGWVKRQYVFSRFVADCARSAGFDAIRYGSTKDANQSNYVLLKPTEKLSLIASLEEYASIPSPSLNRAT